MFPGVWVKVPNLALYTCVHDLVDGDRETNNSFKVN